MNEAAERLRERFRSDEDVSLTDLAADLDEALAAERRATVERIAESLKDKGHESRGTVVFTRDVVFAALWPLDEEAAR